MFMPEPLPPADDPLPFAVYGYWLRPFDDYFLRPYVCDVFAVLPAAI